MSDTNKPQQGVQPMPKNVPQVQNFGNSINPQQLAELETNFRSNMQRYQKSIVSLLQGKHGMSKDEFLVSAFSAIKKSPKLLMCNVESLFGAILLSAEMKLKFNTPDGHAYIIPYGKEANFQIGYKGLIELMYRSSRVRRIVAEPVFAKDEFRYSLGLNPALHHVPYMGLDGRGDLIATYCVVQLKDADPVFTVVNKSELDAVKNLSKAKDKVDSPYNSGTDVHHWMEIKVAIKKVAKLIPKSDDMGIIDKAVEIDSKIETGARILAAIPKSEDDVVTADEIKVIESKESTQGYGASFETKKPESVQEQPQDAVVNDNFEQKQQTIASASQGSSESSALKPNESFENNQTESGEEIAEPKRRGRPPQQQLSLES